MALCLTAQAIIAQTGNPKAETSHEKAAIDTLFIKEGRQLDEVVVAVRRPTLVAKLDRRVFNVSQDLMSQAGSASDLLQNIPTVDVDMDGAVSLRGNENVTILINGKPSAMMDGRSRGDALNQLAANTIERIEVLSNPSAAFKPDGVSGIINIVLKSSNPLGMNGSLTGNVGSVGRNNVGLNMNYGFGRFNLYGGYSFRRDRYDRSIDDHRESSTDIINQTTNGVGHPVSHTFRLGVNASLSPNNVLDVSGSYNRRRFQRNERVESETLGASQAMIDRYVRNRNALARENLWEGTLHYVHTYGKDSDWGVDYTCSSETEDEMNHYATQSLSDERLDNEAVWDANYLHVGKLHWQHHFSESTSMLVGYELEHLRAEQNYHVADWDGTVFVSNADRSSDFTHLRTLHSLYATMEWKWHRWNVLAGLRGEYALTENRLLSEGTSTKCDYANVYPTLHLARRLNDYNEWQLNYSLRVNRPKGSDLNPFAERINPLSLQAGNPNLKPEKIHSAETGWLWRNDHDFSLTATLYYRYITNQITEVSRYVADGVLLTTKENLQSSHQAGLELIGSGSMSRWLSFNLNANGYYNQIDASRLGFGKDKSTFSWSVLANANFTPLRHYMVQLNARFRSAVLVPQGRRDADCRINLGMKYDIPALNLSLLASVTDLFDTYRKSYTLDTPSLKQKVEKRRNPRIVYVGLVWQFGASKSKKHHADVQYDEGMSFGQ